jgi:CheY-like chemotaxis protein
VADDHALVRAGVVGTLDLYDELCVVAQARNGREAVEMYREHHPDITLMDLNMPEMGGVEAIQTIRGEFPDARIIILTTYDGDEDIFRGLSAGCEGVSAEGRIGRAAGGNHPRGSSGAGAHSRGGGGKAGDPDDDDGADGAGKRGASPDRCGKQ